NAWRVQRPAWSTHIVSWAVAWQAAVASMMRDVCRRRNLSCLSRLRPSAPDAFLVLGRSPLARWFIRTCGLPALRTWGGHHLHRNLLHKYLTFPAYEAVRWPLGRTQGGKGQQCRPTRRHKADMTDSPDELMKSYEVIRSIVMRHSQYDAARILTLNLATCITEESKHEETAVLARLADCIRTLLQRRD